MTPAALMMSESPEWYTPHRYVKAAWLVMGGIDLDPASCEFANRIVGAKTYYTKEMDALDRPWVGKVFLNPPYGKTGGRSNQDVWSLALIRQYIIGTTTHAVLLVNARTSEKWFRHLWEYPICFTDHRIKFYNEQGQSSQPTSGNAFVYLGPDVAKFVEVFGQFGPVVARMKV